MAAAMRRSRYRRPSLPACAVRSPPMRRLIVRGDYPEWLAPEFHRAFGARAAEEGAALARRAPIDLRANTLKADRDKVLKALRRFEPQPTPHSPVGVRIEQAPGPGKSPHVEAEPGHGKGWYEVQDEGSQLATLLSGARPRQQVMDLCAGAGGKTLALAALMENSGQLYAYDSDRMRLRPIFERLKRAGVRNAQVLPAGDRAGLDKLEGRMDLVLIDAPCTGIRRLAAAPGRQMAALRRKCSKRGWPSSAPCSMRARDWSSRAAGSSTSPARCCLPRTATRSMPSWRDRRTSNSCPGPVSGSRLCPDRPLPPRPTAAADTLQMTPLSHGTDGFFVAVLERVR